MITFLDALMLGTLALAALPVLIHLLNRKKARVVLFSSLTFLKALQNKRIRRVRLQQWILLVIRTMLVVFLVLAFARPVSNWLRSDDVATHGPTSMILIIDNSLLGTALSEEGHMLDRAKRLAIQIVNNLKDGDEIHVMTTGGLSLGQGFSSNIADITSTLRSITTMFDRPRPLEAIFRATEIMKSAHNPNKEICLISPMQTGFYSDDQISIPEDIAVGAIRLNSQPLQNVALTKSVVTSRLYEPGKPVNLRLGLRNDGTETSTVQVSVFSGDRRIAQVPLTIDAGSESENMVRFNLPQGSLMPGRVEIDDDAILEDNVRYFNIAIPDTISVRIVGDAHDTELIALALNPGDGPSRIRTQRTPSDRMAMIDPSEANVLICSNIDLRSPELTVLESALEKGRSVILFPGDRTGIEQVNTLFATWDMGALTPPVIAEPSKDRFIRFDQVDMNHPMISGLFDDASKKETIESPAFTRVMGHRVGPTGAAVIGLSTGTAFLTESRVKSGKVLYFASAPILEWSDLPVRGIFAPLLVRAVYYLSSPEQTLDDGTADYFFLAKAEVGGSILLSGGGERFAPETRSAKSGLIIRRPANVRPGNYDVLADGRSIGIISMNLFPELTNPVKITEDRLSALTRRRDLEIVEENGNIGEVVFRSRYGAELWDEFVLIAAALMIIDLVISQWQTYLEIETRWFKRANNFD